MAMRIPKAPGFAQMLKEGAKHFSGIEEAVLRNVDACKELAQTTRSAYGPYGQNKMVVNHINKLFVTNDAATILRELEVQHPAAKMLVMASHQQELECGDGTNMVLVFAGALLKAAEDLISMGLSVTEIIDGYEQACKKALTILEDLVVDELKDLKKKEEILKPIRTSVMSKQYGNEDFLADLIADACLSIYKDHYTFNVDHVRVSKIVGQGIHNSTVLNGMVFKRHVEGDVKKVKDAKIAIFTCPLDLLQTETKGTVLIKTAQELLDFSTGEEDQVEAHIKAIADTGCNVIVTGGKVGELYLHYCNKYNVMVVRLMSKFDVRRLCKTVGATPLPRLTAPTPDEAGHCDLVKVDEIGGTEVVVFRQEGSDSAIVTVVIRGATDNIMDDIERAVDDGVNTFKALTKNNKLVPGAGATEIELARRLATYGETCPGMEQYAIKKFAEAFEAMPMAIAENTGVRAKEVLSKLYAVHQEGQQNAGIDIEAGKPEVMDSVKAGLVDLYLTKYWAIKFASSASCTILKVDQIIMAKQSGGPKVKDNKNFDDDD